jgi:hypothetical protein
MFLPCYRICAPEFIKGDKKKTKSICLVESVLRVGRDTFVLRLLYGVLVFLPSSPTADFEKLLNLLLLCGFVISWK